MKQRIITALVLIALIIPAIYAGGPLWSLLLSFIGVGAIFEWQRMNQRKLTDIDTIIALLGVLAVIHFQRLQPLFSLQLEFVQLIFILLILLLASTIWLSAYSIQDAGYTLIGTLYIGVGVLSALEIRRLSLSLLFYLIIVVTMTDTGAYFCGRLLGKHKLAPKISPNKTIEGALGGVILATALSITFSAFFALPPLQLPIILLSILLSVMSQLGDLVISCVKRHFGVKDTGKILPGHGGLLDRFDSLLFCLSILWVFGL